jgi:hypothetical protein
MRPGRVFGCGTKCRFAKFEHREITYQWLMMMITDAHMTVADVRSEEIANIAATTVATLMIRT